MRRLGALMAVLLWLVGFEVAPQLHRWLHGSLGHHHHTGSLASTHGAESEPGHRHPASPAHHHSAPLHAAAAPTSPGHLHAPPESHHQHLAAELEPPAGHAHPAEPTSHHRHPPAPAPESHHRHAPESHHRHAPESASHHRHAPESESHHRHASESESESHHRHPHSTPVGSPHQHAPATGHRARSRHVHSAPPERPRRHSAQPPRGHHHSAGSEPHPPHPSTSESERRARPTIVASAEATPRADPVDDAHRWIDAAAPRGPQPDSGRAAHPEPGSSLRAAERQALEVLAVARCRDDAGHGAHALAHRGVAVVSAPSAWPPLARAPLVGRLSTPRAATGPLARRPRHVRARGPPA